VIEALAILASRATARATDAAHVGLTEEEYTRALSRRPQAAALALAAIASRRADLNHRPRSGDTGQVLAILQRHHHLNHPARGR
jgi:hypothetical protein